MSFRNRRLARVLACFFLLETLLSILAPGVSWAVSGPGQPEFTAYESPGSTDMVNLTTGDLTYNLPILDVPSPERSFSLPLTYRAGIRLEQEASWVGLGWSLNPGAIARSLNGYPDDISDEPYHTTFKKNLDRGWYGGIPGVVDLGWDSETGHSGTVDLIGLASVSWEGGKFKSADLIGVKYTKGEGLSVDPVRMAMAAGTIASAGTIGPLSAGANYAIQAGSAVATGAVMSAVGRAKGTGGFNRPTVKLSKKHWYSGHTNYWKFYNDNTYEYMYGSLYFRDMSRSLASDAEVERRGPLIYKNTVGGSSYKALRYNKVRYEENYGNVGVETAADLHQHVGPHDDTYYKTSMRPLSIAHDNFSVMGGDVSGSIRPQLLEVGSVAQPRHQTNLHDKYSVVSYLNDYKIPFRYENSLSNGYDYHRYDPSGGSEAIGIDHYVNPANSSDRAIILKDARLMELADASTRTAPARKGIRNAAVSGSAARQRGLDQGKHVAWYTNAEIVAGQPGLLEADPAGQAGNYRLTLPGKGIGAFAVTAEDGTTYHYSLPVYHLGTYSETKEVVDASDPGVGTTTMGQEKKVYATTWALTAITSADYVDRGQVGVVDEADWGGWVKFTYGRFGQTYKWRQPYIGSSFQENETKSAAYSEGAKETYYLNAIHTRTHTALFVKSVRNDARGHFGDNNLNLSQTTPASSLRLDEIILLTHADWARLQGPDGIRAAGDPGTVVPALTVNTATNAATWDGRELGSTDSYAYVLDGHDVDADSRIRAFVNARALKRVKFNFSYRLCSGTPSSFPSATAPPPMTEAGMAQGRTGKLTLESVSIFGPQSTKLAPDFKFTYGSNPSYGKDKWDGFGLFNRAGQAGSSVQQHAVATDYQQASEDGAAWSLTEITNPLGAKTRIQYERDTYAHVSEFGTGPAVSFGNTDNSRVIKPRNFAGDLTHHFRPGDKIWLKGTATYGSNCVRYLIDPQYGTSCVPENSTETCAVEYNKVATVESVTAGSLTLDAASSPLLLGSCTPDDPAGETLPDGTRCNTGYCDGSVFPTGVSLQASVPTTRNGGDVRVAALTTTDESNTAYQVRYRYVDNTRPWLASSSGVLAKEPAFVNRMEYFFDGWYDYPVTPVLYGQVTVLRGAFRNGQEADHDQREVYAFYTPASSMISRNAAFDGTSAYNGHGFGNGQNIERADNRSVINLGLIGQPAGIRKYNGRGEQEFATTFNYANQVPNADKLGGQGRFSEGVMTNEFLDNFVYRINRSTKEYVPTVMASTTTVANGMRVDSHNDLYDFFSGQVLETHAKNSLGQEFVTRTVPAYTLAPYAAMGLKSANPAYHNMLTQSAADYVFKRSPTQALSLISAQVQTWNSTWAYRQYNSTSDRYENVPAPKAVWRTHESYVWNGAALNPDGTYAGFVDFNWANASLAGQSSNWLRTGEITLYNQYSQPLESRDLNGQYSASKAGNAHSVTTIAAGNARYQEIAYSGAEDQFLPVAGNGTVVHFGGEVRDAQRRTTRYAHAGAYSSQLVAGGQAGATHGFTYRAVVGAEVTANRKYRLSAWVRGEAGNNTPTALTGAKLYASLGGTRVGEVTASATSTKKAGDWYLLNLYVDIPAADAGKQLTVGCENAGSSTVYFDDFRFQPLLSSMKAYNHDPHTGQVTHVLDNDNLFTRYQYDNAGQLVRVYKEVLDRPGNTSPAARLVKEYAYNYARQAQYPITVNVTPSAGGTVSPASAVQVALGEEATFSLTATNSSYVLLPSFKVDGDGVTRSGTYAVADGTQITLTGAQLSVRNVRGAHTITLSYQQQSYPAAGTEVSRTCEQYAPGCNSGRVIQYLADGQGGVTGPYYPQPYSGECTPQTGCAQD